MPSPLAVSVLPVTPFKQNCTILWDSTSRAAVVIDPGGDAPRIWSALQSEHLALEAIWLTHGHLDHAGGAEALRTLAGGVDILGPHTDDAPLLASIDQQAATVGLTGLANATPDRFLAEGDSVALGEHRFEIRHVPGHTPGHIVFINHAAGFAQVGDTLFAGGIGRTDFPYGNHAQLLAGIKTKLLTLPDTMQFICGHGPNSTIGRERAGNAFLR